MFNTHRHLASVAVLVAIVINLSCGSPENGAPSDPGGKVPIEDEDGVNLTPEELIDRLAEGGWAAFPAYGEEGSVASIVVQRWPRSSDKILRSSDIPADALVIDGSAPIRDESGTELSMDEFMERMAAGGSRPEPRYDEDGELVEILVVRDDSVAPPPGVAEGRMLSPHAIRERWLGKPLPHVDVTTLEGRRIGEAELAGKAVVLTFWFRACKPCILEIPELNELVDTFKDEDVVFLAPTFDDQKQAREVLEEHPFVYEIVSDAMDLHQEFGIESYPTHLVFDANHVCISATSGYTPGIGGMLESEIRLALGKGE